ncbi:MAG: hypothetical protein R3B90_00525 [Planctomycetaceae bacterium]
MRLTLRTLLGYLDDILEPQQTREMGERISESAFASELVARIKEVMRKRRILAPELTGPGSDPDPNVVAEYLDNTLPADRLEDLERLCLDSDMHLAEVAASHQILTLVLGEQVEIPQTMRERMYALGSNVVAEPGSRTRNEAAAVGAAVSSAQALEAAPADPGEQPEVPSYLKSESGWKKLVPVAALCLIGLLWLGLIVTDPSQSWRVPGTGGASAARSDTGAAAGARAENDTGAAVVDPTGSTDAATSGRQAAVAGRGTPANAEPPLKPADVIGSTTTTTTTASTGGPEPPPEPRAAGIDPPPPPDDPAVAGSATAVGPGETVEPVEPAGPAVAMIRPGTGETGTGAPSPIEQEPTPLEPSPLSTASPSLLYNSAEGVLLQRSTAGEWLVLPRRSLLRTGDELANPEPFTSDLSLGDQSVTISLLGGTRMQLTAVAPPTLAGLKLSEGRIVLRASPVADLTEPVAIQIELVGGTMQIALLEPGTECSIEVTRRLPTGLSTEPQAPAVDGRLVVTAGQVRVTDEARSERTIAAQAGLQPVVLGRLSGEPRPLVTRPDWLSPLSGGALTIAMTTARNFEETFVVDQPVSSTVPALVAHKHPRISELAAQALAVTGNYRDLVRGLSAPHDETREAAIIGLASALRDEPHQITVIEDEVARRFRAEEAQKVMRLLWGYSDADARDPATSQQLVDDLASDEVAIRSLAFFHIRRLTGGHITFRYHPDAPASQRSSAQKLWQGHLYKNGNALQAAEPAAAAADVE